MEDQDSVLCYNKGCGQYFDPSKNGETACEHHPGVPVFHDAYKSWSCCSKKTTDFTDFLNIKGCTRSRHSDVKPPEVEKVKADVNEDLNIENEVPKNKICPIRKGMDRPTAAAPLQRLRFTVTGSLKSELLKLNSKNELTETESSDDQIVTPGTTCKNGGCTKFYANERDNEETCMHHPGVPVFHEGLKYWTCCTRRTTDFDNFLEQVGCTVGKHLWIKEKSENDSKTSCRHDWYQTGPFVYLTIYAKLPIPKESFVEANPVKLHAYIVFGKDHDKFDLDHEMFGIVNLESSSVQFAANKVEIKLKKAEAMHWTKLFVPHSETTSPEDDLETNLDDTLRL